jgi:hypothetical protein
MPSWGSDAITPHYCIVPRAEAAEGGGEGVEAADGVVEQEARAEGQQGGDGGGVVEGLPLATWHIGRTN